MSITEIAAATKRPEKVCGMHFFNPAPLMRLVEIIRGYATSDETVATTIEIAKEMGKVTVEIKKDGSPHGEKQFLLFNPDFIDQNNLIRRGPFGVARKMLANLIKESIQTITAYIVQVSLGDTPAGGVEYKTIFAVGVLLFLITLGMNVLSHKILARYREVYE